MPKVPPVSSDDKDQLDRFALLVRELEVRQSNGPRPTSFHTCSKGSLDGHGRD